MLEVGDVTARVRELVRLLLLLLRRGELLLNEAHLVARERVALLQDLVSDRLLARIERAKPRRLRGDGPAGGPHAVDDLHALLANPRRERDLFEQVPEAAGLEHDTDDVRPVRLVIAYKLFGEHPFGAGLERLEVHESRPGHAQLRAELDQLRAFGVEVRLDPVDPSTEDSRCSR